MRYKDAEFKDWLIHKKGLSDKSAGDVVSRLKRVSRLEKIPINSIKFENLESLAKNSKFKLLTDGVRSQLRRAINLYVEYVCH